MCIRDRVLPLYGATEGLALYSIYDRSNLGDAVGYHYSVSGYEEIRIIDENGMDVLNGEEGELIIRGPFTIQSYYNPVSYTHLDVYKRQL